MTPWKKIGLLLPLVSLFVAAPGVAHAAKNPLANVPVIGTSADGNAFVGTLSVLSFINDPTQGVEALGLLNGTITQPNGAVTNIINAVVVLPIELPVSSLRSIGHDAVPAAVSCQILDLVLAPLDLNLLGLTVHLDQVVLNIAAQAGAGALLGNLLCAVTNLLNGSGLSTLGGALLTGLTALLNEIVALL